MDVQRFPGDRAGEALAAACGLNRDEWLRERTAQLRENHRPTVIVVRGAPEPSNVRAVPVEFPQMNRCLKSK